MWERRWRWRETEIGAGREKGAGRERKRVAAAEAEAEREGNGGVTKRVDFMPRDVWFAGNREGGSGIGKPARWKPYVMRMIFIALLINHNIT